jgi:hypothetical protein
MKKILLFVMGAMMATPLLAQEGEDMTSYIQNAGFDEDLTWNADGTFKPGVSTQRLSDRSIASIAADGSLYATVNPTTPKSRKDGRTFEATNGFVGMMSGWEWVNLNDAEKPNERIASKACEWVYFGALPYDLTDKSVPIADDGTAYLTVPARPTEDQFVAGNGALYLRAGWGNAFAYKQTVNLPCAVYKLEYWTINVNPSTSASATDLSRIVCRGEVFKEETGESLNAAEWTKHEFTFTPVSEFTLQFGFQAGNGGSGSTPWVFIDGIKLYKIAEADPEELVMNDLLAIKDTIQVVVDEAEGAGLDGLADEIREYSYYLEDDVIDGKMTTIQKEAELQAAKEKVIYYRKAIAAGQKLDELIQKMDAIAEKYDFPGKAAFLDAKAKIEGYAANGTAEQLIGAEAEVDAAIFAYITSQPASEEAPADYTVLVKNPWFIKSALEPTLEDGVAYYSNEYEEGKSHDDFTSEGWYKSGATTDGDQRLNFNQGRSCWNAWASSISTIGIAQDLTGLPNGYYTVKADLTTQVSCVSSQYVYATTELGTFKSEILTDGGAIEGYTPWSTLTAKKILVTDGKLTIGAMGEGQNKGGSAGWFCATNFRLEFLGEAGEDAMKALLSEKIVEATTLAQTMNFAGDKKALQDSIAKYTNAADVTAAIAAMNVALDEAKASQAKYDEYWMDGKTLPVMRDSLEKEGAYADAREIVEFAFNYAMTWLACDTASYKDIDTHVNLVKNYSNTYAPVYNEAAELAAKSSDNMKAYLVQLMADQKAVLLSAMQEAATVNTLVSDLKAAMAAVKKQNIVDDENASDFTAFIINPNAEGTDGWIVNKGNGDGPIKTSGQWMDDSKSPFFDSWNQNGLSGHKLYQDIASLPNGTYTLGAYVRTPAEGAYLFTATGADTTYVEIPLYFYRDDENQEQIASDTHGPIWEDAKAKLDAGMTEDDDDYAYYYNIAKANSGTGRGWQHIDIKDIVVTDHKLCIGFLAGSIADHQTEKDFAGNWYSVNGFTLTQTAKGDNSDWGGPITDGIENVKNTAAAIEGIYTMTGVRANKLQRGMNIVIRNGKAMKVFVK